MKESYSDINQYNVWEAYEIALERLGAEELCESLARAMGTDALEENLKYIFRTWDIPFMDGGFYEESARRSVRESIDLEADGYEQVSGRPGYNLYRKVIRDNNGKIVKGVWAAQKYDGKTGRTVGEPFEITYDQARGFEPIGDDECLGARVGKALGLRRESPRRVIRKGRQINEGLSDSLVLKLEDFAQEYGGIDYNDISSLKGCWDNLDATTKKTIKGLVSQINKACKETGLDSWELSSEYPEDKEKCEKLVKTIKDACK